jgi:hypothetical protein
VAADARSPGKEAVSWRVGAPFLQGAALGVVIWKDLCAEGCQCHEWRKTNDQVRRQSHV